MARRYEYLFDVTGVFSAETVYFWTGESNVVVGGVRYMSTRALRSLSIAPGSFDGSESRVQIELNVTGDDIRTTFLSDPGPGRVVIRQLVSLDDGASWTLVPRAFSGRLANPVLEGEIYRIEVVDSYGDPLRPAPRYWSHEDQKARYADDDGLKYMRRIESGVDVRWP